MRTPRNTFTKIKKFKEKNKSGEFNDLPEEINHTLVKPGDITIWKASNNKKTIYISYCTQPITHLDAGEASRLQTNTISISSDDFKTHFNNDSEALRKWINSKLLRMVFFDVDKTLTVLHCHHDYLLCPRDLLGNIAHKENLKFASDTRKVMRKLHNTDNILFALTTSASYNTTAVGVSKALFPKSKERRKLIPNERIKFIRLEMHSTTPRNPKLVLINEVIQQTNLPTLPPFTRLDLSDGLESIHYLDICQSYLVNDSETENIVLAGNNVTIVRVDISNPKYITNSHLIALETQLFGSSSITEKRRKTSKSIPRKTASASPEPTNVDLVAVNRKIEVAKARSAESRQQRVHPKKKPVTHHKDKHASDESKDNIDHVSLFKKTSKTDRKRGGDNEPSKSKKVSRGAL